MWEKGKATTGMLRVFSGGARLCDGITRREMLRFGGLGALGLWGGRCPDLSWAGDGSNCFGRAKRVVFVLLYGGPPQTETFDMKPQGARKPALFSPLPPTSTQ